MVAESVPKNRLGSAYGLIQSMDSAGAIAGPLIALMMLSRFGIRSVFWRQLFGSIVRVGGLLGIRERRRAAPADSRGRLSPQRRSSRRVRPRPQGRDQVALVFPLRLIAVTLFRWHRVTCFGFAGAERWNPGGLALY